MTRKFKTADYDATLNLTIRLAEALPPNHLARFIVDVIAQLDVSPIYARYGERGGEPLAPEILLGLLFYGYATGVFSSRKIEKATFESIPFRFVAGGLHPDHDTLANFRKTFLPELHELFVQILLLAQVAGVLKLGRFASAWRAAKFMRTLPRAKRSATNGWAKWRPNCAKKCMSC
jgi:transposase